MDHLIFPQEPKSIRKGSDEFGNATTLLPPCSKWMVLEEKDNHLSSILKHIPISFCI